MGAEEVAADKFLAYYEFFRAVELKEKGRPLEDYKPTEPDRLVEAFRFLLESKETGREFLALVLHELTWRQCLGNANHRTTILFVQNFAQDVGLLIPHYSKDSDAESRFVKDATEFIERSKELLERQNEWGYGPREFEKRHGGTTLQTMVKWLGTQSFAWDSLGAHRLKDFISRSESSG